MYIAVPADKAHIFLYVNHITLFLDNSIENILKDVSAEK
jgi:hypothetical protein